jgi:hypothetical protein
LRKSQISQVFTYIASILVIGLLVVFGYKAIAMMMNKQCDAKRVIFEKSLLDFIDQYSDYGSVQEELMKTPCDVKEICFADASYCPYDPYSVMPHVSSFPGADSVIIAAVDDCKANIFIKSEFTETLANTKKFSDKITLEGDPFQCFKVNNGQINLVFSGLGSKIKIEQG